MLVVAAIILCIPVVRGQHWFWTEELARRQRVQGDRFDEEFLRQLPSLTVSIFSELTAVTTLPEYRLEGAHISIRWSDDVSRWLIRHHREEDAQRYLEAKKRFFTALVNHKHPPTYTEELLGGLLAEYAAEARKMAASAIHRATQGSPKGH